jgi:hypothetical protein
MKGRLSTRYCFYEVIKGMLSPVLVWLTVVSWLVLLWLCSREAPRKAGFFQHVPRLPHTDLAMGTPKAEAVMQDVATLFRAWCAFAEANSVRYVVTSGTLLGAARDGSLLPWDDDVDVLVHPDDFGRVQRLLDEKSALGDPPVTVSLGDHMIQVSMGGESGGGATVDIVKGSLSPPQGHWEEFWGNELPLFVEPSEPCDVGLPDGSSDKVRTVCLSAPEPYLEKAYGHDWGTRPVCMGRYGWEATATPGGKSRSWDCEEA